MSGLNQFVRGSSDENLVKALGMEEQKHTGPYTLATCHAVVFANNIKHIHFHIQGKKFDTVHNITGEYYDKASEDADYLAELGMEKGQNIPNFCQAAQLVPAIVATSAVYSYETAIADIAVYLGTYVSALQSLRNVIPDEDIQSKLDDMIRYWNKELNYKNKQRFGQE